MKSLKIGIALSALLISAMSFAQDARVSNQTSQFVKVEKSFANPQLSVQRLNRMKHQRNSSKAIAPGQQMQQRKMVDAKSRMK